jgi:hypothetical protein
MRVKYGKDKATLLRQVPNRSYRVVAIGKSHTDNPINNSRKASVR